MKFVVVVPWWLYALFICLALAIGGAVVYIGILIGLVILLIKRPLVVLGILVLGFSFRYWFVTVPVLAIILLYLGFTKSKPKELTSDFETVALNGRLLLAKSDQELPDEHRLRIK